MRIAPNDPRALARSLVGILSAPGTVPPLVGAAEQYVRMDHAWTDVASRSLSVYQALTRPPAS